MVPHPEAPGPTAGARRTSRPDDAASRTWHPWRTAWRDAAYAADGFWTRERPADHFSTGVTTGSLVARAVAALAPADVGVVVDVGAGDGQLLARLLDLLPGVVLVGVDRRERPPGLDLRVRWCTDHHDVDAGRWERGGPDAWLEGMDPPGAPATVPLVAAHEWLDDLPTTVAVRVGPGWREVEVDGTGDERPGAPPGAADTAWLARWWPEGVRAEVGRVRDVAWAGLVGAAVARGGRALAVDYGHVLDGRPRDGSLTAYADGRRRRPVPGGAVNLTAGVAVDALAAAGEAAGGRTVLLRQQAELLAGVPDGPAPGGSLAALERRAERAALTSPDRWGGLWWLLQAGAPPDVS